MFPSTGLKVCKPLTLTNGVRRVSTRVSLLSGSCATVKPGKPAWWKGFARQMVHIFRTWVIAS